MTHLRVLGIGSPFGDDRLGWEVIKGLQQCAPLQALTDDKLQLQCCDRPGMRLLELMRNAQSVILIDAVKSGARPGTLHALQMSDLAGLNAPFSSHASGVADALKMGEVLKLLPPELLIYGIAIEDAGAGFIGTKHARDVVKRLVSRIAKRILTQY
ncbi:hydrogenase maturation protease [Legionella geestiana]|uniref:hydrogenase maturation protease n=1 Tax=Legionella geestiana TaxID=45065 RepID=UPI0010922136|nr:hydrogenase maturation protease [Legionella geestiana]QDQ39203.1 hydrogenase maturation protease [Legionella geestiana]